MIMERLKLKLLLAACCFTLVLIPMSAGAQAGGIVQGTKKGVQKGAETVEKGAEGAAQKTKEGAEAVGQGVKKTVTGEDENSSQNRMKTTETQPGTETQPSTGSKETKPGETTETKPGEEGKKNLPKTAGELPLLALAGCLALACAGATRVASRLR